MIMNQHIVYFPGGLLVEKWFPSLHISKSPQNNLLFVSEVFEKHELYLSYSILLSL